MLCAGLLAAMWLALAAADSRGPLVAKLCRDQTCNDEQFPLLDYDQDTGKCHCSAHPCRSDDGIVHECKSAASPHLVFSYTKQGKLECGCHAKPHYMSKYIGQVKCPGEHCDAFAPMLDYDADNGQCFCRAHPCDSLDGLAHACDDPKLPVLHYREEKKDGVLKKVCECKQIM